MLRFFENWLWPEPKGPKVFGWYHFLWLGIMIVSCVVICVFVASKHKEKTDEKVVFGIGAILLTLEFLKQVISYLIRGYYNWSDFPFQFCSIPMYLAFCSKFIVNKIIKEALFKFLASFGLLAGLAVMIYPLTVFHTQNMGILIHTMVWHSVMVILGIYLIVSRRYGRNIKELLHPSIVFVIIVGFALILNLMAYHLYFKLDGISFNGEFNLFYVSPYYYNPIPILGEIKEKVWFPFFFIIYLLAFFIGVTILWGIIIGIRKIISFKKKK